MKIIKILLIIIVVLAAIFFIGGMFLPKTYNVSRSIIINAHETEVYTNVSDFNQFIKWNPWSRMDPSAKVEVEGSPSQPNHLYKWVGKESGRGQMEITKVLAPSTVDILLTFTEPFKSVANTSFTLEKVAEGTKVVWNMSGESSSSVERWMYLNMDNMIGKDFDSGLKNLKEMSEKK